MPGDVDFLENKPTAQAWQELQITMGNRIEIADDSFFTIIKTGPQDLSALMQSLKTQLGMNYLANLTSVDWGEEFEIIYHLYAIPDNGRKAVVKTRVSRDQAEVPSIIAIFPTADWQEREVYDLMGIRFNGHPNLIRVLLPDDFVGHPLRKDYKKEG